VIATCSRTPQKLEIVPIIAVAHTF